MQWKPLKEYNYRDILRMGHATFDKMYRSNVINKHNIILQDPYSNKPIINSLKSNQVYMFGKWVETITKCECPTSRPCMHLPASSLIWINWNKKYL